ncbi:ATP-binding protein [Bradyrhizobium sp. LTSP885]|uniref:sensor histidine kinase n=1 Tax=Bradyrhizobium sp. LTSP885 TaxID=1619232 RepID=UPI0005C864FA|nr:ATP-binding protein [Bradyrhizobium sp. LTSP885]
MNSIRVRITLMLVCSVLCVVVLAGAVMSQMVVRLVEQNFRDGLTDRVTAFSNVITFKDDTAILHLQPAPAEGEILEKPTELLKQSFAKSHSQFDIFVKRAPNGRVWASIKMGPGWLSWPVPDHTPPLEVWYGLAGWMALVTAGVIGVALTVAHQTTKQLKFLETMALSVGKDGVLPVIREEGSAEIKATARALNVLARNLKKAMDSKIRLVAAAGHDLRTPMTRMRLRAEFLGDGERAEWIRDLDEMDRIADSAIQLVREETVGKGTEITRLDELVGGICNELRLIKLPVRTADIEPAVVRISPIALTRALRNLVINAATHGGGAIVSVAASDGVARVVIEDDGPGIPEKFLESAFEPFFRVDPARRQPIPGAGLGLAIAKEIIERQGGFLEIENRHPHGLRQTLSFEIDVLLAPPSSDNAMERVS